MNDDFRKTFISEDPFDKRIKSINEDKKIPIIPIDPPTKDDQHEPREVIVNNPIDEKKEEEKKKNKKKIKIIKMRKKDNIIYLNI